MGECSNPKPWRTGGWKEGVVLFWMVVVTMPFLLLGLLLFLFV
jgi:hypothetical protein